MAEENNNIEIDIEVNPPISADIELEQSQSPSNDIILTTDFAPVGDIQAEPLFGPAGKDGKDGKDGRDGIDGVDGFSPIASVEKTGNTATITITDKDGTTTATVSDGTNGTDGTDGEDGFSPIANVVKVGNKATITITDKDGTTTADVFDGEGAIDDVKVNGTSVVTNKIANIDLTGYQPVGDYATETELTQGLALKQNITDNTLTTTAKTIVGAINELDARPSMPELDEQTITTNSDDELQAIGLVGLTSTIQELNYTDGVTSNIQTQLSSKVDTASLTECQVIIETYVNGASGYNIWSNGYCEQWGYTIANDGASVSFLKTFKDTKYNLQLTVHYNSSSSGSIQYKSKNTNSFIIDRNDNASGADWKASGYLAEGQY